MERIVNKPIAGTFGWLHMGGVTVDLPEKPQQRRYDLPAGETRTVVLEENAAFARIEIELAENACLHFIQAGGAEKERACTDIHVRAADNAQFHWYRLVLDQRETYDNCSVSLEGKGSSFTADIGYDLNGNDRYDVNCEAIHLGKCTKSRIASSGVLTDRASKLLRGTIDFRTGCTGSVGSESEDVLLLSETVRNQSVPVILCSEEDVVGDHGASIGRPDENLLYYMESRGIREDEALKMLAEARIESVISRIPDEEIRDRIRTAIYKAHPAVRG